MAAKCKPALVEHSQSVPDATARVGDLIDEAITAAIRSCDSNMNSAPTD
ncbi:MAG TPA: hypothetical protein VF332_07665 [Vicinamibacterales bacterium]